MPSYPSTACPGRPSSIAGLERALCNNSDLYGRNELLDGVGCRDSSHHRRVSQYCGGGGAGLGRADKAGARPTPTFLRVCFSCAHCALLVPGGECPMKLSCALHARMQRVSSIPSINCIKESMLHRNMACRAILMEPFYFGEYHPYLRRSPMVHEYILCKACVYTFQVLWRVLSSLEKGRNQFSVPFMIESFLALTGFGGLCVGKNYGYCFAV